MTGLDMARAAVAELGTGASPEQVAEFARLRFGRDMPLRFVPVYLATIRGEELLRLARENAATILAEEVTGRPSEGGRRRVTRSARSSVMVGPAVELFISVGNRRMDR